MQEVPENGADVAHLSQVHGPIMTAGVDLRFTYSKWWSFARHNWSGEWSPHADADQKHVGVMKLLHGVQIFSWRFPVLDLRVCAKQVGLAASPSVGLRFLAILADATFCVTMPK